MLKSEILNYDRDELIYWLTHKAGSSNTDYFGAKTPGGLKLQQVPQEYSDLLLLLKRSKIENYLAIGIGNGGSFALECFFMSSSLKKAVAVDNLAYGSLINQNKQEVIEFIQMFIESADYDNKVVFSPQTSDDYFKSEVPETKFDAIFIDGDHSYEGAKRDYENSLKHLAPGGMIIFHDINSEACPGIQKLWREVVGKSSINYKFIHGKNCGIGVIIV